MYDANYLAARRRVDAKIGFCTHLAVYLAVNAGLIILSLLHGHTRHWLLGPLLGWGIGLLFHGMRVFVRLPVRWKQRLIEQELRNKN